jgi:hypothetical protein
MPEREEYFLNLRFRTLGSIGKQIETKLEAVSSGLTYFSIRPVGQAPAGAPADTPLKPTPPDEYVRKVFPGLEARESQDEDAKRKFAEDVKDSSIDPGIEFLGYADRIRFSVRRTQKQWEGSLAELIRPFTEDASFDDVLLVEPPKNRVLFQRSYSTPRVRDVTDLLKEPGMKDSGVLNLFHRLNSQGRGSDTDLVRAVELDGSPYQFLAQPLTIRVPQSPSGNVKELVLCGLVRSARIRQEAMHVPPKYLLWIIVPLFAGLLSGPMLKLILVRRTGRFETRDVPLIALCSSLAMAMLTVVLLAYHFSTQNTERIKQGSKDLANGLTQEMLKCFTRGRRALKQVETFVADKKAAGQAPMVAMNLTRIWSWTDLVNQAPDVINPNLEFIFWTNDQGDQTEKWTPLETNTPLNPQGSFTNYQDAVAGRYWHVLDAPADKFTAELLISPTTSAPIAVLTMPSKCPAAPLKSSRPCFVSVVETPRNLLSPVIPPDTGFALVQGDGSVVYHSDHDRILSENLFRETEYSEALVDAIHLQSEQYVAGRYRGRNVAFYVRPIREVVGIPWTLVVFRNTEPWQALAWQVGWDVLLLSVMSWFLPALAFLTVLSYRMVHKSSTWKACRIAALRYYWPQGSAASCYRTALLVECALIIVFVVLFAWFGWRPDGVAGTALLTGALLLPVAALAGWTWSIRRAPAWTPQPPAAAGPKPYWRAIYVAVVCLTLISSSVLPVAGFFHLALHMESKIDLRRWQWDLADRLLNYRASTEASIRQSANLGKDAMDKALAKILPGDGSCDNEQLYRSWASTTTRCGPMELMTIETPWWEKSLQSIMGRNPEIVPVGQFQNVLGNRTMQIGMALQRPGDPGVEVESVFWRLPLLSQSPRWWMFAGALFAAGWGWVWSASSRLFLFGFHQIPLRRLRELNSDDLKNPILVLGLPRSGKDKAVSEFLDRVKAESAGGPNLNAARGKALRKKLDLKINKLDEAWLARTLQDIGLGDPCTPPVNGVPLQPTKAEVPPGVPSDADPLARMYAVTRQADRGVSSTVRLAAVAGAGEESIASVTAGSIRPPEGTGSELTDGPTAVSPSIPDFVHVTNLEAAVYDRGRRDIAMRLLDSIVRAPAAIRPKLVVTSVVDPTLHFDIIFPDQKDEVDRSHLPEAEFGRWAHVFLQFERVVADENPSELKDTKNAIQIREHEGDTQGYCAADLWEECRHHRVLRLIGQTIAQAIGQRMNSGDPAPAHEQLVAEVQERAFPLYELFWSACTRPEKLLLVQLAQTGLVNPTCTDTLHDLIRKRLVTLNPYPSIMNDSFTRFLRSAATGEQIEAWEKEAGESHWLTVRNVLLIVAVFVLLMIGMTQDHALQSISGILTAVVGGLGGVFKLVEIIASKWSGKATSAPAKA